MAESPFVLRLHPRHPGPVIAKDQPLRGRDGPYIADSGLITAANVALTMGMPLLLTGEPGCGKTDFAFVLAHALADLAGSRSPGLAVPLECHIRSDSRARDLLYAYDALLRFADGQHGGDSGRRRAQDACHYVTLQALGRALTASARHVVLIDEIDKAPRDLPNDLLRELDRGDFEIPEIPAHGTRDTDDHQDTDGNRDDPVRDPSGVPLQRLMRRPDGAHMPVVVITSNVERQLPDPFLRRCVFYHIPFPDRARLRAIVQARFPDVALKLDQLVDIFISAREIPELVKKPSTAELLAWVGALARTFDPGDVSTAVSAFHGALARPARAGDTDNAGNAANAANSAGGLGDSAGDPAGPDGVIRHRSLRWTHLPGVSCLFKLREDMDTAHACRAVPA